MDDRGEIHEGVFWLERNVEEGEEEEGSDSGCFCNSFVDSFRGLLLLFSTEHPASPVTILEPQNPWIDEFYVVQESVTTDSKAPKWG